MSLGLSFAPGKHGEAANRPLTNSSIQLRAFAIAMSRASRREGVIGVLCAGTWTMPLTAAGTGLVQGTVIV